MHNDCVLLQLMHSEDAMKEALICSYKNAVNGFSATLTPQQVSEISSTLGCCHDGGAFGVLHKITSLRISCLLRKHLLFLIATFLLMLYWINKRECGEGEAIYAQIYL